MSELPIRDFISGLGVAYSPPIDVDAIASCLNINVVNTDLFGSVGEITFKDNNATIKIDNTENGYDPRRRFTLAHEIGHFILHKSENGVFTDTNETMKRTNYYWDGREAEANNFAAQILMPKDLIISHGQSLVSRSENISIDDFVVCMSSTFNVSQAAMRFRLINLGIINN